MTRSLYIAVEGPIGAGKTTLVHRLAQRLEGRVVLEIVEENPFLALFYDDRDRYAFQTQLFFLMSRFKQQQELVQADLFAPNTLADYHLLKDRIFAHVTLSGDEALHNDELRISLSSIMKAFSNRSDLEGWADIATGYKWIVRLGLAWSVTARRMVWLFSSGSGYLRVCDLACGLVLRSDGSSLDSGPPSNWDWFPWGRSATKCTSPETAGRRKASPLRAPIVTVGGGVSGFMRWD